MTRAEAEAIIARIASFEIPLKLSPHFWHRARERGFIQPDALAVLRAHVTEYAPRWNETHSSYRVSLRGICRQGRPTRVILDLHEDGCCTLVTIMVVRDAERRR